MNTKKHKVYIFFTNYTTMKQKTIVLLFLFLSVSSFSQNFKLGFQTSPHITWMSSTNSNIEQSANKLGIKYGLEADIYIAGYPRYCLNTGLFVSNYSFSGNYSTETPFYIGDHTFTPPVDLHFKLNYIAIPLNIKLRSEQFYRITFFGQFGLSNLFNISASVESSDVKFAGDQLNKGLGNRSISFYNLQMIMGGGVEYDVGGNTAIVIGLQYENGLSDISKISPLNEKSIFNSARLALGVMF